LSYDTFVDQPRQEPGLWLPGGTRAI